MAIEKRIRRRCSPVAVAAVWVFRRCDIVSNLWDPVVEVRKHTSDRLHVWPKLFLAYTNASAGPYRMYSDLLMP